MEEEEQELIRRPPRSPSIVPLANGVTPAGSDNDEDEDDIEITPEELQAYIDAQRPVVHPLPEPTRAQISGEIAREIGREKAREAMDRAFSASRPTESQMKKLEKSVDPMMKDEKAELCRRLNGYRNEYRNKINYKFKLNYTTDMKLSALQAEDHEVKTILNSQDLPTILKDGLVSIASLLEKISLWLDWEDFDLNTLTDDVEINIKSGYFDSELKQLSIDWAEWLAQPPHTRVGMKMLWLVFRKATANSSRLGSSKKKTSLNPSRVESMADL